MGEPESDRSVVTGPPDLSEIGLGTLEAVKLAVNKGDYSGLDAHYDQSVIEHVNSEPDIIGLDGIKAMMASNRMTTPDSSIRFISMLVTGDRVVAQWISRGMVSTPMAWQLNGCTIVRYENGKAVETWAYYGQPTSITAAVRTAQDSAERDIERCGLIDVRSQPTLAIRRRVTRKTISQEIGPALGAVMVYAREQHVQPAGAPFVIYHSVYGDGMDIEIGYPFAGSVEGRGDIRASQISEGVAAACLHVGPYSRIVESYDRLSQWMMMNGHMGSGIAYEIYLNDPQTTPPEALQTRVVIPLL